MKHTYRLVQLSHDDAYYPKADYAIIREGDLVVMEYELRVKTMHDRGKRYEIKFCAHGLKLTSSNRNGRMKLWLCFGRNPNWEKKKQPPIEAVKDLIQMSAGSKLAFSEAFGVPVSLLPEEVMDFCEKLQACMHNPKSTLNQDAALLAV